MPRKMRPGKIRRVGAPDVSTALYLLLLWSDWQAAHRQSLVDESDPWEMYDNGSHEAAWHAIEATAVAEWVEIYPGSRPPSWWYWSAPELRMFTEGDGLKIGGARRCHETGIPYIANGRTDPPIVESTPAYLDRLGLWLPGERERVPAEAFAARRFSYADTGAPKGIPDQIPDDAA